MKIERVWAMPHADTFSVKPIGNFVRRYMSQVSVSVDPFARNKRWATHTNDISPETSAEFHMEAEDYLNMLAQNKVEADLFIFDPPYSPRQLKECYNSFGRNMQLADGQIARLRKIWKNAAQPLIKPGGIALSFGWNSVGMGIGLGFELIEILLVCHGADHNDTICLAERKIDTNLQTDIHLPLFDAAEVTQ